MMDFKVGQIWETRDKSEHVVVSEIRDNDFTSWPVVTADRRSFTEMGMFSFDKKKQEACDLVKLVGRVSNVKFKNNVQKGN